MSDDGEELLDVKDGGQEDASHCIKYLENKLDKEGAAHCSGDGE
jgi:hypothetical protein